MARSKNTKNRETRDPLESLLGSPMRSPTMTPWTPLTEVSDMRAFNFEEPGTPRLFNSQPAQISVDYTPTKTIPAPSRVPYQIAFSAPAETLVCVRRKTRREVIFAKKRNGRGGQRRAKWSLWSKTKC